MIAPDESYILVFTRRDSENFGQSDLYISYRTEDGLWTELKNLGPKVNSYAGENCQTLSPCGKYLFFTSRRSTKVPDKEFSYKDLLELENSPENGKGDIYWVRLENLVAR